MRDINIFIKDNHTVDFENDFIGLNLENLQGNIIFNFDTFIEGTARVETIINNQDGYILLDRVGNTYTLPIKSSLLTGDSVLMQVVIEEPGVYSKTTDTTIDIHKTYFEKVGESYVAVLDPTVEDIENYYEISIPVWKSEIFYLKVGASINATATIPEEYPTWVEIIDSLINNTENAITRAGNVNISSEQLSDGVKVTTTNQNGEQTVTIVPQGPQGEPGVPGAVKFIIVQTLPTENIDESAIYLVPSEEPTTQDLYLEYMYINNQWELLGQKQIVVDLTDYVKFTDTAGPDKAGVMKVTNGGSGFIVSNGFLRGYSHNYQTYVNAGNDFSIAKGTLENVITGKGLVSNTDYANSSTGGVIKVASASFTSTNSNGIIIANKETYASYQTASDRVFISKGTLENVLTARIGDIQTLLDALDSGNGV